MTQSRRFLLIATAVLAATILGTPAVAHATNRAAERAWIAAAIRTAYPQSGDALSIGSMQVLDTVGACPDHPLIAYAGNGPYRTARVQCPALGWQFYVPFTLTETATVVVAARDLSPGVPLTAADLRRVPSTVGPGPTGFGGNEQAIIGETLTVPVARGEMIARSELQEPLLVRSGQNLSIEVQAANVEITTTAVALQDGRRGQAIWVKNPDTGKRYQVTVTGTGRAGYRLGYR